MKKLFTSLALSLSLLSAIEVGETPSSLTLSAETGGTLEDQAWNSDSMKGSVVAFFYVDPDVKDRNDAFGAKLKEANLDKEQFKSVAVINLAATWLPNALIQGALEKKQKQFPDVLYIKDKKSVLVKEWKLEDDNSDVLIFDKEGKCIFKHFGKLSDEESKKAIELIKKLL